MESGGSEPKQRGRLRGPWWYPKRRQLTAEQRDDVFGQLYYEGPDLGPFLSRFAALLAMSVLIATFGLASNSAAVVIGAMLISPLTTPLLGLATALVLGRPRRQLSSLAIVVLASIGGIALAYVVMALIPEAQRVTEDSEQLLARTNPNLLDLAVAIVAGSAGAYVLVRREAISVVPGVAIAVALVPPLATTGMTLQISRPELAEGALLLYLTNLVGIVLAAAVTLLVLGVSPKRTAAGRLPRRVKVGLTTATIGVVVVGVPLVEQTRRTAHADRDRDDTERLAEQWVEDAGLEVDLVTLTDTDKVRVEVSGPREPPPLGDLAEELAEEVELTVAWTPRQTRTVTLSPSG